MTPIYGTTQQRDPETNAQLTASFIQQGGSHISYEDKLTTKVIPTMLVAFTAASAVIANLIVKRRREGGGMHPTLKFMLAALGMHWVFLAVHTLHLRSLAGWCLVRLGCLVVCSRRGGPKSASGRFWRTGHIASSTPKE